MATEKISTSIIADDAVTGDKIENNPTVAGNLTVSGNSTVGGTLATTGALTASGGIANAGTITAGTLGSSVRLPQGAITNVHCSTNEITPSIPSSNYSTVAGGSSVSYTPATGARFVVYQYKTTWDNDDQRSIVSFKLQLDSYDYAKIAGGWDNGTSVGAGAGDEISVCVAIDLSNITNDFPAHSSHNWQTNSGGTSAFSAGTLRLKVATYNSDYQATLHQLPNAGDGGGVTQTRPTTLIYSVM